MNLYTYCSRNITNDYMAKHNFCLKFKYFNLEKKKTTKISYFSSNPYQHLF